MLNFALIEDAFPNDDKYKLKKQSQTKASKTDCSPIQAPIYSTPICDTSQTSYQKAIETSLNSTPKNDFKKDGIKAYDYDEMDAYLNISGIDLKTNNRDNSDEYRTTPFLLDYLKGLKENLNKNHMIPDKTLDIEQFTNFFDNKNNLKVDVNLYNLFLFIFLGIIIILLVHQITQLTTLK
jgi:hypothetical protein